MKNKDIVFDGSCYDYLMRVNGFGCGFNMPEALSGESSFGLPPYAKRMPYLVDKYPACPENWMRSEGKVKSYFVPVVEGKGMWLDLNENCSHTHNVAVVISIQGVNPITGMPCKDAHLEQYIEECPKHKAKFGPDRYCEKCGYKWPKQNYISTTATPDGAFWIDGFRSIDGVVRQYILTEEKMRGVAANIIGKDRVYAIGLSFFTSKEKKPVKQDYSVLRAGGNLLGWYSPIHTPVNWQTKGINTSTNYADYTGTYKVDSSNDTLDFKVSCSTKGGGLSSSDAPRYASEPKKSHTKWQSITHKKMASKRSHDVVGASSLVMGDWDHDAHTYGVKIDKNLEVGAGANINQKIYDDPERLDYWHDEPDGIICISYCTEALCKKIVEKGEVDLSGHPEGFLKEVPVGN